MLTNHSDFSLHRRLLEGRDYLAIWILLHLRESKTAGVVLPLSIASVQPFGATEVNRPMLFLSTLEIQEGRGYIVISVFLKMAG